MSGGHMLVNGVSRLAKTMMVKALADLLGWEFRRIQFAPDLMPADITGTEILQSDETGRKRDLMFHGGPVFANLILADEINRAPPKTQAALLEAMQELDFESSCPLIHCGCLKCDFCSSDQRFAYSFLQIPPRGGHPCCSASTSPCRACIGL